MKKLHTTLLAIALMLQITTSLIAKNDDILDVLIAGKECIKADDFVACTIMKLELQKSIEHMKRTPSHIANLEKLATNHHCAYQKDIESEELAMCTLKGCTLVEQDLKKSFEYSSSH